MNRSEIIAVVICYAAILTSSFWVAYDSSKINLSRYRTGISYKPWILFLLMIPLWYISFPWYVVVRYRIRRGRIRVIDPIQSADIAHGLKSSKGKFGVIILVSGIITSNLLAIFFDCTPEELIIYPNWFLGLLYGLGLFSVSAVIFGGIYTLYVIVLGWLENLSHINKEIRANK